MSRFIVDNYLKPVFYVKSINFYEVETCSTFILDSCCYFFDWAIDYCNFIPDTLLDVSTVFLTKLTTLTNNDSCENSKILPSSQAVFLLLVIKNY